MHRRRCTSRAASSSARAHPLLKTLVLVVFVLSVVSSLFCKSQTSLTKISNLATVALNLLSVTWHTWLTIQHLSGREWHIHDNAARVDRNVSNVDLVVSSSNLPAHSGWLILNPESGFWYVLCHIWTPRNSPSSYFADFDSNSSWVFLIHWMNKSSPANKQSST